MKIKKQFYYLGIFILLIKFSIFSYFYFNLYTKQKLKEQYVIIPKACTIKCAANIFAKNNIIQNKNFFINYLNILNILGKKIVAGEYKIAININNFQIFNKITSGKVVIHKVTIPEGLTVYQIINLLKTQHGLVDDIEDIALYKEGELFANTYEYLYTTNISYVLKKMIKKMNNLLELEWKKREKSNTLILKTPLQALILASIVEKEAKLKEEKSLIAGVYLNRLKKNMPLQADPTIIYAISKWDNFNRKVTYNDLKIKSPYNTYRYPGLPPTSICNPGRSSIIAVLHPKKTNALYFVADNTGKHTFSNHYNQHLKNIRIIKNNN